MGTRAHDEHRMAGKFPSKNTGPDTTRPNAFHSNAKVVVAPHDCDLCRFHIPVNTQNVSEAKE